MTMRYSGTPRYSTRSTTSDSRRTSTMSTRSAPVRGYADTDTDSDAPPFKRSRYSTRSAAAALKRERSSEPPPPPSPPPPIVPYEEADNYHPNAEYIAAIDEAYPPSSHSDYSDHEQEEIFEPKQEVKREWESHDENRSQLRRELQQLMDIKVYDSRGRELKTETVMVTASPRLGGIGLGIGDVFVGGVKLEKKESVENFEPFEPLPASAEEFPLSQYEDVTADYDYEEPSDGYDTGDDDDEDEDEQDWEEEIGSFRKVLKGFGSVLAFPVNCLLYVEQLIVNGLISFADAPVSSLVITPPRYTFRGIAVLDNIVVSSAASVLLFILHVAQYMLFSVLKVIVKALLFVLKTPYFIVRGIQTVEDAILATVFFAVGSAARLVFAAVRLSLFILVVIPALAVRTLAYTVYYAFQMELALEVAVYNVSATTLGLGYKSLTATISTAFFLIWLPYAVTTTAVRTATYPFRLMMWIFSLLQTLLIVGLVAGLIGLYIGSDGFRDPMKLLNSINAMTEVARQGLVMVKDVPALIRSLVQMAAGFAAQAKEFWREPTQMKEALEAATMGPGKWTLPVEGAAVM